MNDRDLLHALADLAHLCASRPDRPSFASSLVLRVLRPFGARATAIGLLDAQGALDIRTTYGFAPGVLRDGPTYELTGRTPVNDAVRTGRVIDAPLAELRERYTDIVPLHLPGTHMIAMPLTERGTVAGGMGVTMDEPAGFEHASEFWNAVAALVTATMTMDAAPATLRDLLRHSGPLTERQLQILRLLQRGHTNGQIAKALNFGTSTIGHDVMRIFDVLGVASRRAAVAEAEREGILDSVKRVEGHATG